MALNRYHRFDEFRIARRVGALNRVVQGLLWVALIIGLNLLAFQLAVRWDLTPERRHTLSPETQAYLSAMTGKQIRVIVTAAEPGKEANRNELRDVKTLMSRFEHAFRQTGEDGFKWEVVDVFRQRDRAAELIRDFALDQGNAILFESEQGRRVLNMDDLYRKDKESGKTSFVGEQMVLSALLEVTDPSSKVVYFTVGQGEMRLGDVDPLRGLSELGHYLTARNVFVRELDLTRFDEVPGDADLVVIASPQAELRSADVEKLRKYMENGNGSMFVLLEPFRVHNLDALLYDWGILCDNGVVLDPGPDYQASSGGLILRRYAEHPVTASLIEGRLNVFSTQLRPVRFDPGVPRIAGVQRSVLMATSETSWLELNARTESVPKMDPNVDVPGPIPVAAVSERKGGQQLGLNLKGGRLVVVGDASIASNALIRLHGNRTFVANVLNWMLQRDQLLSIAPTALDSYRLTLSQKDLRVLLFYLMLIPLLVALVGLLVRLIHR